MMNIELMREKTLLLMDPDSGYTQEDFNDEFGGNIPNMQIETNRDYGKIKLSFVNKSNNPDPEYATAGSSGFDLRANLKETVKLTPQGGFAIIPTGLFFEIPQNFEIQVRSRSGLAAKNQVAVLNSPGTIDADYRGELKVILINLSNETQTIHDGDRIAQIVFQSVDKVTWQQVEQLDETKRGAGGFGHTGKK